MGSSTIFLGRCRVILLSLIVVKNIIDQVVASQPSLSDVGGTFDVMKYGAIGDGKTDNSKAFLAAWKDACLITGGFPTIVVPPGSSFLLKPVTFLGPCKSSQITFSLQGTIVSPNEFDGWTNCKETTWIYFGNVQGLHFTGSGKIDGRGALWWRKPIPAGTGCAKCPTALRFKACNSLEIKGTTHADSPWNHIEIEGSQNVEISGLNIIAPFDSPNTDGIDISTSSNVNIHDTNIGTGDDCIAIKRASYFINITRVHCGPGHGISVGSLGEGGASDIVEHVFVSDCTLNGTTNGARIKTWQSGSGHVTDVTFQGITLVNTKHPIIIDQLYVEGEHPANGLQLSDITFRGFQGTSDTEEAILLQCGGVPCTNVKLDNIQIKSLLESGQGLYAKCQNAHGTLVPPVVPNVTCLLR